MLVILRISALSVRGLLDLDILILDGADGALKFLNLDVSNVDTENGIIKEL